MDRNSVKWWGPIPAIVTPFDDRGAIDEKLLASNIDLLMANGATGIVIGGCTGEFWAMSMEERKRSSSWARRRWPAAAPSSPAPAPSASRTPSC